MPEILCAMQDRQLQANGLTFSHISTAQCQGLILFPTPFLPFLTAVNFSNNFTIFIKSISRNLKQEEIYHMAAVLSSVKLHLVQESCSHIFFYLFLEHDSMSWVVFRKSLSFNPVQFIPFIPIITCSFPAFIRFHRTRVLQVPLGFLLSYNQWRYAFHDLKVQDTHQLTVYWLMVSTCFWIIFTISPVTYRLLKRIS